MDPNTETNAEAPAPVSEITVALKNGATVVVDINLLPNDVFAAVLEAGLKAKIEGSGMSKLGPKYYDGKDDPKLKADTQAKADENVQKLYKGEIGTKKKAALKVSGKVKTAAMGLARDAVKAAIKAAGGKISHYKASEISAVAKDMIEADPSFIAQAEELLKAREAAPVKVDIMAMIKADPELVAKAEKEKAEKAAILSAAKAGQTKKRAKGAEASA